MPQQQARVLIVDDDVRFAEALKALLESERFAVVGCAYDGSEGIELAVELRPSVVTMDIDMPILDGVAATAAISASGIPVVVLSGSDDNQRVRDAIAAGAVASVRKTEALTALAPLLRGIAAGSS